MKFTTLIALVGMTQAIRISGEKCAEGAAGDACRAAAKGLGDKCAEGAAGDACRAAAAAAKFWIKKIDWKVNGFYL